MIHSASRDRKHGTGGLRSGDGVHVNPVEACANHTLVRPCSVLNRGAMPTRYDSAVLPILLLGNWISGSTVNPIAKSGDCMDVQSTVRLELTTQHLAQPNEWCTQNLSRDEKNSASRLRTCGRVRRRGVKPLSMVRHPQKPVAECSICLVGGVKGYERRNRGGRTAEWHTR